MSEDPEPVRWDAIDELRGLTILLLVIFNAFFPFVNAPEWLKHAPGNGFTIADLIAPLFMFSVGLSYSFSFKKRRDKNPGTLNTVTHFLRRNALLIIFGVLGEMVFYGKPVFNLGVLGAIGFSSIICLPAMFLTETFRPLIAICFLIVWQMLNYMGIQASTEGLGGPSACLAWSSIILTSASLSSIKDKKGSSFFIALLCAWLITHTGRTMTADLVPINKHLVTTSYILLSLELSLTAFAFFCIKYLAGWKTPFLSMLGKNPIILYMVSGVTSLLTSCYFEATLPLDKIIPIAALQVSFVLLIAWLMDRKKLYVRL